MLQSPHCEQVCFGGGLWGPYAGMNFSLNPQNPPAPPDEGKQPSKKEEKGNCKNKQVRVSAEHSNQTGNDTLHKNGLH